MILLICFASSYIAEKGNTATLRLFARWIVFLCLVLPAALRYETGTDYGNYVDIFLRMDSSTDYEIGWKYLNLIIKNYGLSVQWIFVISAILIYYPICFKLNRKHFCISIVLYIILGFYFKSYNTLRQSIAVSFVLWAIIDIEKKKYVRSVLLILVGYLFHISVLFILPCLLISQIKLKGKWFPFAVLVVGLFLIIKVNVLEIVFNVLALASHDFARYAGTWYANKMVIGTGLGILISLGSVALSCFFYSRIVTLYPSKKNVLNLTIIYIWTYFLAAQYIIFGRLRDLFIFVPLLISGYAFEVARKYRIIIQIVLIILTILLFEYDISQQTRDTFSNEIYPYYSIFYNGEIK